MNVHSKSQSSLFQSGGSINYKIKMMKQNAYGYQDLENFSLIFKDFCNEHLNREAQPC